ncbi:MAG: DUF4948 domain-containing protein [Okeania sp. SIO3B5]|uniref:hypothetical protein n=1 Tax=Okeania sp. SIO3B5 TaxID=2607811 RepID=UPI0014003DD4|nr:hypothetical protein [Okeania sp. SIO3B5]NEO51696.1 DUF4948 domain-containing protein [Okeania sp. SIO3B5]
MALWSVIVYGRTKEADYRFLAIPDDFGTEEQNWARKYIHGTTVYPERLQENPRWSLFKNHKHCVFGVTCMVQELVGSERQYEYMAKNARGRSLHIFVGYVAQINEDFNPLKILPDLENLEFFKPEYLLISLKKSWNLKDYQVINKKIYEYPYNLELNYSRVTESTGYTNKSIPPEFIPCLEGENRAFICPDNPENRQKLWENCCKFFDYPYKYIPLSLCLSLSQKKDVLEGPFSNATTSDATQHIKLSKLLKRNSKVINDSSNITAIDNRDSSNRRYTSSNSLDTPIKGLLHSISWKHIITILLISTVIFLILLVIRQNYILVIAIFMSLLIGFYLGIIFEHITIKDYAILNRKLSKRNLKVTNNPSNTTEIYKRYASKTTHNSSHSFDRRSFLIKMILLISISIGLVLLVIWKKYTLAIHIIMSLLVGLYVQHVSVK